MSFPILSEILIRPAQPGDAGFVAEMIYLSMDKLADYLFEDARGPVITLIRNLVTHNAGRFGSGIAFVAEADGRSLGVMVSFEGARLDALNLAVIPHLFPVTGTVSALRFLWRGFWLPGGREAEKDEYYVSNVGVPSSAQGRGIGSRLLAYAEQTGQSAGLKKCALVIGLYNRNALRLYQRLGYRIVETVQHPSGFLGYHRMVKDI
ncbi:MAG: GNAT family N-acetyltransferase [Anaerolineales bacterium]